MTVATLGANLLILVCAAGIGVGVARRCRARPPGWPIVAGALAATAVLAVLILARATTGLASMPVVAWLAVVVALEEAAKIGAVALTRREAHRPGAPIPTAPCGGLVGLGFALAENLLYLLNPPWVLLVRMATAGPIHIGTGWLYGRALSAAGADGRRALPLPAAAAVAIVGHLAYNLIAGALDQIFIVW